MQESTYVDGKGQGLHTQWYENGQKKVEGTFVDGKAQGLVTGWYENGQKMGEGTFVGGKESGPPNPVVRERPEEG